MKLTKILPGNKLTNSQTHFDGMATRNAPGNKLTKLTKLTRSPTGKKLTKLTKLRNSQKIGPHYVPRL